MFGKRIKLFNLFGFTVHIDLSWLIIAVLITWSLATGFFPMLYEGISQLNYWIMGVIGALGLFFSIVFHEFFHSYIARKFGLPMKGITLFLFGGVAEMHDEPDSPKTEFFMALAGPLSSLVLVGVFFAIYLFGKTAQWADPVVGVFHYLWIINGILIAFNMIPGYPLDGGRVLRSILWHFKGDIRWATKIASRVGGGFGMLLIALGVISFIFGNFVGGIWWFLIGMFIRGASKSSYQRVLRRETLEGEPLRRFISDDPVSAPPDITLRELVEDYIYTHHYKMYPVMRDGKMQGCITTKEVKAIPRSQWDEKTVGEVASSCSTENTIDIDESAVEAFRKMNSTGNSRLIVTDGDRLAGIIALKDLTDFLQTKLELEGQD